VLPLHTFWVHSDHIPKNSFSTAAMELHVRGQLTFQFLGNEMIFIPELHHPGIADPRSHPAIGARPIHGQNRFPDHKDMEMIGSIPS
jgi:hypothetical protein